jgi:hypothetical protein
MQERGAGGRPKPEQTNNDTVRATLHPLHGEPFIRLFPDLPTWQRVRQYLRQDYIAIEVEEASPGKKTGWTPNAEHTVYTGLWRGKTLFDAETPPTS